MAKLVFQCKGCRVILFQWKLAYSPTCLLCGFASESLEHIQCCCSALKPKDTTSTILQCRNIFRGSELEEPSLVKSQYEVSKSLL